MQNDGNLVLYDGVNGHYWDTMTYNNTGAYMIMQDDGNLKVWSASGTPLYWALNYSLACQ